MGPGFVCVAGYDPISLRQVRPVLPGRLPRRLAGVGGGPFELGYQVDLGDTVPVVSAPEVEDHRFDPESLVAGERLSQERFWSDLESIASADMGVFGDALQKQDGGYALLPGHGAASLACFEPRGDVRVMVDAYGKIRCYLQFDGEDANLSVTDLRLVEEDHKTPRVKLIEYVNSRLKEETPRILALGLARAWRKPGDTLERHWLQVNNIHLAHEPYWG